MTNPTTPPRLYPLGSLFWTRLLSLWILTAIVFYLLYAYGEYLP
jgi:hypothetical protein